MQCNTMIIERVIEYDKVGFIKSVYARLTAYINNVTLLVFVFSQWFRAVV